MKAALIPPIPELPIYGKGDFHLLLTHLLSNKSYLQHYQEQRRRGAYLVLDNSAHEYGAGEKAEKVMLAAQDLNAQEVVVPDVLEDGYATIESALLAMECWFEGDYDVIQRLNPTLHYVPQGKDYREWRQCLLELIRIHIFTAKRRAIKRDFVIGVSKDYESWPGGLMRLCYYLEGVKEGLHIQHGVRLQVHLLGWGRDLWALPEIARRHPWIRSTDSAKPFVYAKKHIVLDPDFSPPPYPRRGKRYFERSMTEDQRRVADVNVYTYLRCAQGEVIAHV